MSISAQQVSTPERGEQSVILTAVAVMDFDTFYRLEFPAMVALARSVCGDAATGEDLAQEALSKAHQKWNQVSQYDRPGAWLRRVTINLAISRRRRMANELRMLRRKALERRADEVIDTERDDQLWDAVQTLPPRQRAVIALFYMEDRSTRDIAEILNCSISTATSHLNLARNRLADELGTPSGHEQAASVDAATANQRQERNS